MRSSTSSQAQFFRELRSLLRAPYPLIHLRTHEEERAVELLRRLAGREGRAVAEWSPVRGFVGESADVDAREAVGLALERVEATQAPAIVIFKGGHHLFERARDRRRLRELAATCDERGTTLVFVTPLRIDAPELDKELARLAMPLPSREVLRREGASVFKVDTHEDGGDDPGDGGGSDEAAALAEDVDLERMVAGALGLTAREARRAFHRVRQQWKEARERNAVFDAEEAILSEKQRMIGESEILEFHPLEHGLEDIGGLETLKGWLDERQAAFGDRARAFGLPTPKGMLLIGVQGCGKSLTAKAVARHWGLPLLRLDLGSVFDGRRSPEEALRSAIQTCEAIAPCVMWVDEIEKGFAGDSEGRSERVLGSLLTWQQEKTEPVFLVATANEVQALPPELMRKGRFDEIFFIDLPGLHEREEILRIHLNQRGRNFGAEIVEDLAHKMEYFSGAEIEHVVVSGMYSAFGDDRELAREDLEYALRETVPLYRTYEERIKALREWAHGRARPASQEEELLDFFG